MNSKEEIEVVVRNPNNQRIRTMFKMNCKKHVEELCKNCFEMILYQQTMQFEYLFQLLDYKQISGFLMELKSAILGIEDFRTFDSAKKKIYSVQYNRDIDTVYNCLVNIATQMLIDVKKFPDGFFDQAFIHDFVLMILEAKQRFLSSKNFITESKKEFLDGLIKDLIEAYNFRLETVLAKIESSENFFSRLLTFSQYLAQFKDITVASFEFVKDSNNLSEFKEQIIKNKIDISYIAVEDNKNEMLSDK